MHVIQIRRNVSSLFSNRNSVDIPSGPILPTFWALEQPQDYPFIIIGSDTALQGGINIANIKYELEDNDLLKQDYGTFSLQNMR